MHNSGDDDLLLLQLINNKIWRAIDPQYPPMLRPSRAADLWPHRQQIASGADTASTSTAAPVLSPAIYRMASPISASAALRQMTFMRLVV